MDKSEEYLEKLKANLSSSQVEASLKNIARTNNINLDSQEANENEDTLFDTKRKRLLWASVLISLITTIVSFYYVKTIFEWSFAATFIPAGLLAYIYIDEVFLPGNSIKKLAENGIAVAIAFVGLIFLFTWSVDFGDRWIGGAKSYSIEENVESISDSSRTYGETVIEIGNEGNTARVK